MRVVAGPDGSKTFQQAELDRHADAMSRLAERARKATAVPNICTLVLRSPASAPAHALIAMKASLAEGGIQARLILAKLEPERDLFELFEALRVLTPEADSGALIRWVRNPRLWDAHEQVTYGLDMCWSGDPMRRDGDKRNALALFETAPDAAFHAAKAFKALWGASAPVPAHLLDIRGSNKPAGACEQTKESPVAALRPAAEVWPLVRH